MCLFIPHSAFDHSPLKKGVPYGTPLIFGPSETKNYLSVSVSVVVVLPFSGSVVVVFVLVLSPQPRANAVRHTNMVKANNFFIAILEKGWGEPVARPCTRHSL